jgi:hypothetical protein
MDGDKQDSSYTSANEGQTTLQFAAVQSVYSGACLLSFYTNLLFLEQTLSSMFPVFFLSRSGESFPRVMIYSFCFNEIL